MLFKEDLNWVKISIQTQTYLNWLEMLSMKLIVSLIGWTKSSKRDSSWGKALTQIEMKSNWVESIQVQPYFLPT